MLVPRAETSFREGMNMLARNRANDALAYFSAALEIHHRNGRERATEARYLSYHGLCLGLTQIDKHAAIHECRAAVRREPYRSDLWFNLGRVALAVGKRAEAYRAFQRGLALEPGNPRIVRELRRMGIRRRPALPFLARGNRINVFLGQLRPPTT